MVAKEPHRCDGAPSCWQLCRFRCGFENLEVVGVAVSEVLEDIGIVLRELPLALVFVFHGFGEVLAEVAAYGFATVVEVEQLVEQCRGERVGNGFEDGLDINLLDFLGFGGFFVGGHIRVSLHIIINDCRRCLQFHYKEVMCVCQPQKLGIH